MPTYERVDGEGKVVERSVTFAGFTHDLQLSTAASNADSPWFALDDNGARVKLNPMPVFAEPAQLSTSDDSAVDNPTDDEPAQAAAQHTNEDTGDADESAEDTEE